MPAPDEIVKKPTAYNSGQNAQMYRSPVQFTFNSNGMTKHRTITEEFADPDYPFEFETIRRVEAAGFKLDRRFGNFWVYTLNFRRDAALESLE